MARKGETTPKKKFTAQEKGKRKAGDSPQSAPPPRTRARTHSGIHISEPQSQPQTPQSAPPQTRTSTPRETGHPYSGMSETPKSRVMAFKSQEQEDNYLVRYAHRHFSKGKTVDFTFFIREGFQFIYWLHDWGLRVFLLNDELVYDDLVRLFYFHFTNKGTQFFSYLRGVEISFSEKEFVTILKLPYYEEDEDMDEEDDHIDLGEAILFFTGNESLSHTQSAFTNREFISVEYKLLHSVISHCLFPKGGGFDTVTMEDVKLMWCIVKRQVRRLLRLDGEEKEEEGLSGGEKSSGRDIGREA